MGLQGNPDPATGPSVRQTYTKTLVLRDRLRICKEFFDIKETSWPGFTGDADPTSITASSEIRTAESMYLPLREGEIRALTDNGTSPSSLEYANETDAEAIENRKISAIEKKKFKFLH